MYAFSGGSTDRNKTLKSPFYGWRLAVAVGCKPSARGKIRIAATTTAPSCISAPFACLLYLRKSADGCDNLWRACCPAPQPPPQRQQSGYVKFITAREESENLRAYISCECQWFNSFSIPATLDRIAMFLVVNKNMSSNEGSVQEVLEASLLHVSLKKKIINLSIKYYFLYKCVK